MYDMSDSASVNELCGYFAVKENRDELRVIVKKYCKCMGGVKLAKLVGVSYDIVYRFTCKSSKASIGTVRSFCEFIHKYPLGSCVACGCTMEFNPHSRCQ